MPMCMRALRRMAPSLYREAISAMPLRVRITIRPAIDRPWRRPCRPSPPSRQPVDQCAKRMCRICDTHFDAVFVAQFAESDHRLFPGNPLWMI
jgi:hypothetical protein